jgi:hypothetical protein
VVSPSSDLRSLPSLQGDSIGWRWEVISRTHLNMLADAELAVLFIAAHRDTSLGLIEFLRQHGVAGDALFVSLIPCEQP